MVCGSGSYLYLASHAEVLSLNLDFLIGCAEYYKIRIKKGPRTMVL